MRHDELRALIADSSPGNWRQVYEGPLYRQSLQLVSGADGVHIDGISEHATHLVYDLDIDLTITTGMPSPRREGREMWLYEGQRSFADSTVRVYLSDIFWRGQLVDRVLLGDVDGGRCYLPFPRGRAVTTDRGAPRLDVATRWENAFAVLLNGIENPGVDYAHYFETAGLVLGSE